MYNAYFSLQLDYNMSIPQWNFLRLLSSEARQRFTYRCENSVGWEDSNQGNYDKAVLLLAANDEIMTYGNAYITLIKDTCKVSLLILFLQKIMFRKVWNVLTVAYAHTAKIENKI